MRSEVTHHLTDTAGQIVISKLPYAGATLTVVAGYSLNEWVAIFGIVFTVFTFLLNVYMQMQRLALMKAEAAKPRERWNKGQDDASGD